MHVDLLARPGGVAEAIVGVEALYRTDVRAALAAVVPGPSVEA